MITQDIVRKLWDAAGFGNVAVWDNDTMTVVPGRLFRGNCRK